MISILAIVFFDLTTFTKLFLHSHSFERFFRQYYADFAFSLLCSDKYVQAILFKITQN